MQIQRALFACCLVLSLEVAVAGGLERHGTSLNQANGARVITVNRARLSEATIQSLESAYHTRLLSGNFWYDRVSGLWGIWGGPAMGQIAPRLRLGGALPWNASGGATNVFINGRAIHPLEYQYLLGLYGTVPAGRYWLNAQGVGGLEGRAASFNLGAGSYSSGGDWIRRTPGGTVGGSGNCFYYNDPESGSSVMTGPGC
jgi:hypothetical protein